MPISVPIGLFLTMKGSRLQFFKEVWISLGFGGVILFMPCLYHIVPSAVTRRWMPIDDARVDAQNLPLVSSVSSLNTLPLLLQCRVLTLPARAALLSSLRVNWVSSSVTRCLNIQVFRDGSQHLNHAKKCVYSQCSLYCLPVTTQCNQDLYRCLCWFILMFAGLYSCLLLGVFSEV